MTNARWMMGCGLGAALLVGACATTAPPQDRNITRNAGSDTRESYVRESPRDASTGTADASASGTGSTASTLPRSSSGTTQIEGAVQRFDPATQTITLKNSPKILRVDSSTQVLKDGHQGTLTDISEGDQVRASYTGEGDTVAVTRLEVMPSGSSNAPGAATR